MTVYLTYARYKEAVSLDSLGRIIGLDVGSKYVGVALSDTRRVIASPLTLYKRQSFQKDALYLKNLCDTHSVNACVVGLPRNLNGDLGTKGQEVMTFVERIHSILEEAYGPAAHSLDVVYWDERFSTMAVDRTLISADMSRKKREHVIDKAAATYILQGFLDTLKRSSSFI